MPFQIQQTNSPRPLLSPTPTIYIGTLISLNCRFYFSKRPHFPINFVERKNERLRMEKRKEEKIGIVINNPFFGLYRTCL